MLYLRDADDEIDYPTSDGEPLGESDLHRDLMIDLIEALKTHYQSQPDVYVSGNIILYYEQGNPGAHISPDVLITTGVEMRARETYKLWEVGKAPELVIEVTSRTTKLRDIGIKKGLYEALGVREYILFDPRNEYLKPRFQVFRREGELFVPYLTPEGTGYASLLGLTFKVVEDTLRIYETATGVLVPTPGEMRLSLKKEQEKVLAEREKAEAEREKAEAEKARADRLADKLRKMGLDPDE